MKHRRQIALWIVGVMTLLAPATTSFARQQEDEDAQKLEARLEGYPGQVRLTSNGVGLTWMFGGALGVLAMSVLFKNAKRTHLD